MNHAKHKQWKIVELEPPAKATMSQSVSQRIFVSSVRDDTRTDVDIISPDDAQVQVISRESQEKLRPEDNKETPREEGNIFTITGNVYEGSLADYRKHHRLKTPQILLKYDLPIKTISLTVFHLLCILLVSYMTREIVLEFLNKEMMMVKYDDKGKTFALPAITFCSEAMYGQVAEEYGISTTGEAVTYQPSLRTHPWDKFPWKQKDIKEYMERVSFNIRNHLLECFIAGQDCLPDEGIIHSWTRTLTEDRGCTTLRLGRNHYVGDLFQLVLLLDDTPLDSHDLIIDYYIHDAYDRIQTVPELTTPISGQLKIWPSKQRPGPTISVAAERRVAQQEACEEARDYGYHVCLQSCIEEKITEAHVECSTPWLANNSSRTCDNFQEFSSLLDTLHNNVTEECHCPFPCATTVYSTHTMYHSHDSDHIRFQFYSRTEWKGKQPMYVLPQLMGDIGGLLSLFYGQELIFVVNIIDILLLCCAARFASSQDPKRIRKRDLCRRIFCAILRIVPTLALIYYAINLTKKVVSPNDRIDVNNSAGDYWTLPSVSLCLYNSSMSRMNKEMSSYDFNHEILGDKDLDEVWDKSFESPRHYLDYCHIGKHSCDGNKGTKYKWSQSYTDLNGPSMCDTLTPNVTEQASITLKFNPEYYINHKDTDLQVFIHSFSKLDNFVSPRHPEVTELYLQEAGKEFVYVQETRVSRSKCRQDAQECLEECATRKLDKAIDCTLPWFPTFKTNAVCGTKQELDETQKIISEMLGKGNIHGDCKCHPTCYPTRYTLHDVLSNGNTGELTVSVSDEGSIVFSEHVVYGVLSYISDLGGFLGLLAGISNISALLLLVQYLFNEIEKRSDAIRSESIDFAKHLILLSCYTLFWAAVLIMAMEMVSNMTFDTLQHYFATVEDNTAVIPAVSICFKLLDSSGALPGSDTMVQTWRNMTNATTLPHVITCIFTGNDCMGITDNLYQWTSVYSFDQSCHSFQPNIQHNTSWNFDLRLSTDRKVDFLYFHKHNELPSRYFPHTNAKWVEEPEDKEYHIFGTSFTRQYAERNDCDDRNSYSEMKCLDSQFEKPIHKQVGCYPRWMYGSNDSNACTSESAYETAYQLAKTKTNGAAKSSICSPHCTSLRWSSFSFPGRSPTNLSNPIFEYNFKILREHSFSFVDSHHFSMCQFVASIGGVLGFLTGGSLLAAFSLNPCKALL